MSEQPITQADKIRDDLADIFKNPEQMSEGIIDLNEDIPTNAWLEEALVPTSDHGTLSGLKSEVNKNYKTPETKERQIADIAAISLAIPPNRRAAIESSKDEYALAA